MNIKIGQATSISGMIRPPSDKSLTHRSILLGSIATTPSTIFQPLLGDDPKSTIDCIRLLGASVEIISESELKISPPKNWIQPKQYLTCGNSGTTARLILGLLATRPIKSTLVGDESLSKRPMARVTKPLSMMGATFLGDHLPLTTTGVEDPRPLEYNSPVASGQIKSAILLAGLRARGITSVTEPSLSRDHTERMLRGLGVNVTSRAEKEGSAIATLKGPASFDGFQFTPPADISSAAFFLVAAAMQNGSDVILQEVGINPSRTGILDVLKQCQIEVNYESESEEMGEPKADIRISGSGSGEAFFINGDLVPRLIDEIPILAILATKLNGVSSVRDAREMRVKETDRIEKMADGLRKMGANIDVFEDGMDIHGPCSLHGAIIDAEGDHRIAMSFVIAGLFASGETTILGSETISTSYPNFLEHLHTLTGVSPEINHGK